MNDPITQWLSIIAGLINPALPGEALEPMLVFKPHIRSEFSPQWLTPESALAVAEARRFTSVPGWDIIAGTLREYAKANRPINAVQLPAPREPDHEAPSERELQSVSNIMADFANWRADNPPLTLGSLGGKLNDVSLKGDALEIKREQAPPC